MQKRELLYEGKAKQVYTTDDPALLIVRYKDDATAFNGKKRGTIPGKGAVNNQMSNALMRRLESSGIATHFVKELNERETLVRRVQIVPLELVVRNCSAGSFCKRYAFPEGQVFLEPVVEYSFKNDALGDPLTPVSHILALGLAAPWELEQMERCALQINTLLRAFWRGCGVTLVDFKLEFGRLEDGSLLLADEISPDTCRLWDSATGKKLDKDRFRLDLGGTEDAYAEVLRRLRAGERA